MACERRSFVAGCNQLMDITDFYAGTMEISDEGFGASTGGSVILSPFGKPLAGPVFGREEILMAEIDHREIIRAKMDFDPIGHYSRSDIFSFDWKRGK